MAPPRIHLDTVRKSLMEPKISPEVEATTEIHRICTLKSCGGYSKTVFLYALVPRLLNEMVPLVQMQ